MVTVNHFIFVSMAINIRTNNVRRRYFLTKTPDDAIGLTKVGLRLFFKNLEDIKKILKFENFQNFGQKSESGQSGLSLL